jgi:hypothetical protein
MPAINRQAMTLGSLSLVLLMSGFLGASERGAATRPVQTAKQQEELVSLYKIVKLSSMVIFFRRFTHGIASLTTA